MLRHLAAQKFAGCTPATTWTQTYIPVRATRVWFSKKNTVTDSSQHNAEWRQEVERLERDTPELSTTPSWSLETLLCAPKSIDTSTNTSSSPLPSLDRILSLARLDKPSDPKKVAQLEQDLARMAMFLNQIHTMACAKTEDGLGSSPSSPSSSHEAVDWASVPSLVSIVDDGSGLPTRPASESRGDHDAAGGHKKKLSQQDEQELIKHRETLLARAQHSKGNFFVVQTGSNIATQE